jgi:MFS transporter, ACS family, tartrate transporter
MQPLEQALDMERRVIGKVSQRLLPFLIICYFVAYLDRVNVSFAALTMNKDLGFTATVFGWGAGIFFLGYFIFEVPSNLALERFGARIWISRIMVTWGLLSACMAFIWSETSFLILRFLLGVAEAGFFPGIILFLTYWFPAAYRARIVGYFMVAIPVSTVIGAPLSGLILGLNGVLGLRGWQWLFVIEGVPAVLLSCCSISRTDPRRPSGCIRRNAPGLPHGLTPNGVTGKRSTISPFGKPFPIPACCYSGWCISASWLPTTA